MKKLLALATTAALSTSAVATPTIFGEVSQYNKKSEEISVTGSHNSENETALQGSYRMANGLILGAESAYDWSSDSKGISETSLGAAYRFNINDNFYIMPQAIYTFQDRDSQYSEWLVDDPQLGFQTQNYNQGDKWEIGLQTGYHMDNGFFVAGRYGYGKSDDTFNIKHYNTLPGFEEELIGTVMMDENIPTHTFDLTAGYEIPNVAVFTATWTHARTADNVTMTYVDAVDPGMSVDNSLTGDVKGKSNEVEIKAAYLGMGNIQPFVSYTVKDDYNFSSDFNAIGDSDITGKADNVLQVGVTVNF